jgi:hypothetical protein
MTLVFRISTSRNGASGFAYDDRHLRQTYIPLIERDINFVVSAHR